MANPFKPDDKVITKQQGVEVEAVVRLIFNDEVQVRTPDGVLRWRTAKTVWFPEEPKLAGEAEIIQSAPDEVAASAPEAPVEPSVSDTQLPAEEPAPELEERAGDEDAPEEEISMSSEADAVTQEEVEPRPPVEIPPLVDTRLEYGPCGVPETMAQRKRSRKGGRRR